MLWVEEVFDGHDIGHACGQTSAYAYYRWN
jgi:hypothetical protein